MTRMGLVVAVSLCAFVAQAEEKGVIASPRRLGGVYFPDETIEVGFSDTTCAPCAVYAAYNAIRVEDKGIRHGFGMAHSCFGSLYKEIGMWLTHD